MKDIKGMEGLEERIKRIRKREGTEEGRKGGRL